MVTATGRAPARVAVMVAPSPLGWVAPTVSDPPTPGPPTGGDPTDPAAIPGSAPAVTWRLRRSLGGPGRHLAAPAVTWRSRRSLGGPGGHLAAATEFCHFCDRSAVYCEAHAGA